MFAFFAAGVTVGDLTGLGNALADPITIGIISGLVVDKVIGIFGAAFVVSHLTRADP